MEAFPVPTMGPDSQGWRSMLDVPTFSLDVQKEIALLEEMRLNDNFIYTDTDGRELNVTMFCYPQGAITKFTQFKGDRHRDKRTQAIIDTRVYKTPHEGTNPNGFVSYYIVQGTEYDIDQNPVVVKKHHQCLPSEFAAMIGWKEGDGVMSGKPRPDTTPKMPERFTSEPEKIKKEKIQTEARKGKK